MTDAIFILFVLLTAGPQGAQIRPVVITQEFYSKAACETAAQNIRNKIQNARIELMTCERK